MCRGCVLHSATVALQTPFMLGTEFQWSFCYIWREGWAALAARLCVCVRVMSFFLYTSHVCPPHKATIPRYVLDFPRPLAIGCG